MKNKIKVILVVIAVITLVLIIYRIYKMRIEVEKLTLCSIKTYDGQDINDYINNNRAFKIIPKEDGLTIKVNGKEYNKEGIYEPGEYKIEINKGKRKEKTIVYINKFNKQKRNEYDLYCINATYPLFLVSMDIINNKDNEGILWFSRYGTLNIDKIKQINPNIILSEYLNEETGKRDFDRVNDEMADYVKDVLKKDKNAYFKLYIDDFLYWFEYPIFEELGISEDKYEVIMYSDGTLSYTAKYGIMQENAYDFYNREKDRYKKALYEAKKGMYQFQKLKYLRPSEEGDKTEKLASEYDSNYILLATLRDNVTYYLQYPELLTYQDNRVKKEMEKANIKKMSAEEKYKSLSEENKKLLNEILYLDKKYMDKEYFGEDKEKLVITGANPFYGKYKKEKFEEILKYVYKEYGEKYQLLYKPQPKAKPDEEQTKILERYNIKILPEKLPMEAIMFIYDNIKLGGFPSTLYMSTSNSDTLFFFEESIEELVEPLNLLYNELFSNSMLIH